MAAGVGREAAQHARDHESEQCSASQACNKPYSCSRVKHTSRRNTTDRTRELAQLRAADAAAEGFGGEGDNPLLDSNKISDAGCILQSPR